VAHTLGEALRRCRAGAYDVALCDIGLPDGSGLDKAQSAWPRRGRRSHRAEHAPGHECHVQLN
jgi:CheY-like chemotaxis protein